MILYTHSLNTIPVSVPVTNSTQFREYWPHTAQCGCTTGCRPTRCSCAKYGGPCTRLCACGKDPTIVCKNRETFTTLFGPAHQGLWLTECCLDWLKDNPQYFTGSHAQYLFEDVRKKLFDCSVEDEVSLPKCQAFEIPGHDDNLFAWANKWIFRNLEDKANTHELIQELFRLALAQGPDKEYFYSFCYGGWTDTLANWHCPACVSCKTMNDWHCKNCNQCNEDTSVPCKDCGGVSNIWNTAANRPMTQDEHEAGFQEIFGPMEMQWE